MKAWAVVTVALYVLALIALTMPFVWSTIYLDYGESRDEHRWPGAHRPTFGEIAAQYGYWVLLGILAAAQVLFLVVPVKAEGEIRIKPRHLFVPLATAGLFALLLVAGVVLSVWFALLGDGRPDWLWEAPFGEAHIAALIVACWVFWLLQFKKMYASFKGDGDSRRFMDRLMASLLKGSLLELLVAISCHIVVRRRGDCSSPMFTFWAIAAGICVMLLSFGPGVFYLFAARKRSMRPRGGQDLG